MWRHRDDRESKGRRAGKHWTLSRVHLPSPVLLDYSTRYVRGCSALMMSLRSNSAPLRWTIRSRQPRVRCSSAPSCNDEIRLVPTQRKVRLRARGATIALSGVRAQ
eukprot:scaffold275940_cov33-Tisochrysis_lutea.AAC.8